MSKKMLLLRILIPVLIVAAVAAIWWAKTHPETAGNDDATVPNEDFVLEAESIDLDALKEYELPMILDFGSDDCIPCRQMAPALKTVNEDMRGKAIIKFVDVWKNPDAVNDFPIQLIPTQIFINADGTPYIPGDDIKLDFILYSYKDTGEHIYTAHQGGLTEEQMKTILADMGADHD